VCGSPRLCRRRERRLVGARFGRWREERFGRARCLTLRYSLLLSMWVDPSAEHSRRDRNTTKRNSRTSRESNWFVDNFTWRRYIYEPCSAVSEVKGKESNLQWPPRCLSKPRRGYLQTRANCRSGSRYLPELLIARA